MFLIEHLEISPAQTSQPTPSKPATQLVKSTTWASLSSIINAEEKTSTKSQSKSQKELILPGSYHFDADKALIHKVLKAIERHDVKYLNQLLRLRITYHDNPRHLNSAMIISIPNSISEYDVYKLFDDIASSESEKQKNKVLEFAIDGDDLHLVNLLLDKEAIHPRLSNIQILRAFTLAMRRQDITIFNRIIVIFPHIANLSDDKLDTPLFYAISQGYSRHAKVLLNTDNINLLHQNVDGMTALILAVREGNLSIAKRIIDLLPALINMPDKGGNTPIFYAVAHRRREVLIWLLDTGNVNLIHQNNQGENILIRSAWEGDVAIMNQLISIEPKLVNMADHRGNTPTWYALANNKLEATKLLLNVKNNNIDHKNKEGQTLLMLAARENQPDIAKQLLSMSVSVNEADENGMSALMHATIMNNTEIARNLLKKKANVYRKNREKFTALELAYFYSTPEMARLLESYHKKEDLIKYKHLRTPVSPKNKVVEPPLSGTPSPKTPHWEPMIPKKIVDTHSIPTPQIGNADPGFSWINTYTVSAFILGISALGGILYCYKPWRRVVNTHSKVDAELKKPNKRIRQRNEPIVEGKVNRSPSPISRPYLTQEQTGKIEHVVKTISDKHKDLQEKATASKKMLYQNIDSTTHIEALRQATNNVDKILSTAMTHRIKVDNISGNTNNLFSDQFDKIIKELEKTSLDFSALSVEVDNLTQKHIPQGTPEKKYYSGLREQKKIPRSILKYPEDQKVAKPLATTTLHKPKHRKPRKGDNKDRPQNYPFFQKPIREKNNIPFKTNLALIQKFIKIIELSGIQEENSELISLVPTTMQAALQGCMFFIATTLACYDYPGHQQDYLIRLRDNLIHGRTLLNKQGVESTRLAYCDFITKIKSLTESDYRPFSLYWLNERHELLKNLMGFHHTDRNTTDEVDVIALKEIMAKEEASLKSKPPVINILCEVAENFLFAMTNTKRREDAKKGKILFPQNSQTVEELEEMTNSGNDLRHSEKPTYFPTMSRRFPDLRLEGHTPLQEKKGEPEPEPKPNQNQKLLEEPLIFARGKIS